MYQRAYDIAEASGERTRAVQVALGIVVLRQSEPQNRARHAIAPNNWSRLDEQSGDEALLLEAIHCRWSTAFFRGDIARLLADGREGIRHYDPERHSRLGAEFGGHDPGVCAYVVLGLGLAQFGNIREARDNIDRGVALGERLGNPSSLTFACMNAMTAYEIIGDRNAVARLAQRMMEVADKFNLPPQRSIATFMSGWISACGGDLPEGLQIMESEFARVSSHGPASAILCRPACERPAAKPDRSRKRLSRSTRFCGRSRSRASASFLPEIHRLRAECLLRIDPANFDDSDTRIRSGHRTAKQQQARLFWLRAAIGLSRVWTDKGCRKRVSRRFRRSLPPSAATMSPPSLPRPGKFWLGLGRLRSPKARNPTA